MAKKKAEQKTDAFIFSSRRAIYIKRVRHDPVTASTPNPQAPIFAELYTATSVDWSTSYQASASSSAGAEEESSDEGTSSSGETVLTRGRAYRRSFNEGHSTNVSGLISQIKRHSQNIDSKQTTELLDNYSPNRTAFTAQRSTSPATALRYTSRIPMVSTVKHNQTIILPDTLRVTTRLPRINISFHFTLEFRTAIENLLLLIPLSIASYTYHNISGYNGFRSWTFIEIPALIIFTVIYLISISLLPAVSIITPSLPVPVRPSSPALGMGTASRAHADGRRSTVSACSVTKDSNLASRIWMSESRNYRDAPDDGAITALLLAPLIATGMLIDSEYKLRSPHPDLLPKGWVIESPPTLPQTRHPFTALEALVQSRRNLVQLMSLSSMILLVHFYASRRSQTKQTNGSETGLPKTEGSKTMSYVGFTCIVTAAALSLKMIFHHVNIDIWQDLSSFDVAVISFFYQFTLYVSLRLARQGFTVGELGLVAQGATALFMELVNLTIAKIWPVTTPFIKTFRLPTPLLIYQLALIPGSLLTGFLLSPILVLSRHSARQPTKRLRNPKGNKRDRRFLALAFYGLAALIVGGLIGLWTRWCLDKRNPWLWVILWLLEGRKQWSRIGFLFYWGFLGIISVAGWNRQLARARRYRHLAHNAGASVVVPAVASVNMVIEVPNEQSPLMSGVNVGNVNVNVDRLTTAATELLDAADKHVPTLGRNGRRKYFHALAVIVMLPGIAFDPAFLHFSLSAAFALFVFVEYVRYFALYPFGAAVHLFLNEFLDHKDSGTAILSHFYLLTGCAGPLWLEGCRHRTPLSLQISAYLFAALLIAMGGLGVIAHWALKLLHYIQVELHSGQTPVIEHSPLRRHTRFLNISCSLFSFSSPSLPISTGSLNNPVEVMDDDNEQRRLNLPALQPISLGDALRSSTVSSTRFYVPAQTSHTSSKGLNKRPSTAALAQSNDVLLPATRQAMTTFNNVDDTVINSAAYDARLATVVGSVSKGLDDRNGLFMNVSDESTSSMHLTAPAGASNDLHLSSRDNSELSDESFDWASFLKAYAAGKWDPRLTPDPPKSQYISEAEAGRPPPDSSLQSPVFGGSHKRTPGTLSSSSLSVRLSLGSIHEISPTSGVTAVSVSPTYSTSAPGPHKSIKYRRQRDQQPDGVLPHLPLPPPPSRPFSSRSMSDSTSSGIPPHSSEDLAKANSLHELQAAAATMRLAAEGVDVRPLAIPSPEVELTDPFRGHTASLTLAPRPDSDEAVTERETNSPSSGLSSEAGQTGRNRKVRLNSFWNVLGDVIGTSSTGSSSGLRSTTHGSVEHSSTLPTISASPPITPEDGAEADSATNPDAYVTADLLPSGSPSSKSSRDYFTIPVSKLNRRLPRFSVSTNSLRSSGRTSPSSSPSIDYISVFETSPVPSRVFPLTRPPLDRTVSEPVGLKNPDSDPFSLDSSPDVSTASRSFSESYKHSRIRVKEEVEYLQRGYLRPPTPPNEWERQKALYKFNIVHTAKDANFDRIALLAKLVFNAKICLISLIDADEQWFKSEFGLGRESCPRDESICSHAILQDSSEPLVILDTQADWRFSKSPFVVSHPFARFYAGAPLRTAEGYNIGSLCIIDTETRSDFGPRQRHTLKEFAMEQFTRECLEIDTQAQKGDPRLLLSSTSMEKIYDRAAKLVKRTLDVEGAVLIDVSTFEEFDTHNSETSPSVLLYYSDPRQHPQTKPLTPAGFALMTQFFREFPDGKISEAVLPACIRGLMPGNIHYALTVPIMNIDKRPFAMLCAYNTNAKTKPYLEGHELSYLRAIGVIILSAVLKRRMILADKAKSLFISNISHELRTPLHGILAAAELLSGTDLTPNQKSFLSTVQACGTSLVETVNHVLDFTKLSGSTKASGGETVIRPAQVDLAQLVEEATEGCWIGHRARHSSEIGSVYSPQNDEDGITQNVWLRSPVETVVDIGHRPQLPLNTDSSTNRIKLELGVSDSGKGISEDFLKNQIFQPFSQENPLQPGTGLGLAIVNSIVRSESVNGKIDVWSAENVGTDIRITFEVEALPADPEYEELGNWTKEGFENPPTISLLGFGDSRGQALHKQIIAHYLTNWWHFELTSSSAELGDMIIINEDAEPIRSRIDQKDCSRPLIFISSARGNPLVLSIVDEYERAGGFARIVFKPAGPTTLHTALRLCTQVLRMGTSPRVPRPLSHGSLATGDRPVGRDLVIGPSGYMLNRRRSDGTDHVATLARPVMTPRSATTYNLQRTTEPILMAPTPNMDESDAEMSTNTSTTISVGSGGLLLKASVGTLISNQPAHVLVVEDNSILRDLLYGMFFIISSPLTDHHIQASNGFVGYYVQEAADGQSGVDIFKAQSFDVVLLDMSMPVLDGVGAATAIRRSERERRSARAHLPSTPELMQSSRLIALTGMSSREDKRKAFEAGVDGYLVKPVSFKTLQSMFKQLGIT
ncbi:hypothetical protein Clacol_002484 [Clathrus columnatus]|uniref:dolichol kinase n=1 Tax=Clathrus columnatus TaxID=1419009 RepID=A0AAV5A6B0_9AGAM|nr:hypothetical protein Clacol_002484 [Clathrus columnatus]